MGKSGKGLRSGTGILSDVIEKLLTIWNTYYKNRCPAFPTLVWVDPNVFVLSIERNGILKIEISVPDRGKVTTNMSSGRSCML